MRLHPLDRPVWNALHSGWSALAVGGAHALRLDPEYGPFAAAIDASPVAQAALSALTPPTGELWIVEADSIISPLGAPVLRTAQLIQMTAKSIATLDQTLDFAELAEPDATDMRALASLTRPGPFEARTHALGHFIGLRREGRLVAMAGERMKLPGFTEVSGVCTHPDHRGKGHAGTLLRTVAQRIIDRGETPFLHAYASNTGAIALYQALGFTVRRDMHMLVLGFG